MKNGYRTIRIAAGLGAVSLALVLLAGCGQGAKVKGANEVAARESQATADARTTAETAEVVPVKSGWELVQEKCTTCHLLDRIENARLDWSGWSTAIDHMVDEGAGVSDAERKVILEYLAESGTGK